MKSSYCIVSYVLSDFYKIYTIIATIKLDNKQKEDKWKVDYLHF